MEAKAEFAAAIAPSVALALILLALLFAPFYIRSGVRTLPEFMERRYGASARTFLAFIGLIGALLIHIGISLFAAAKVFYSFLGVPMDTSLSVEGDLASYAINVSDTSSTGVRDRDDLQALRDAGVPYLVERDGDSYGELDLQLLSVVASLLGAYLDKKGKGATMMIFGSALLMLAHLTFAVAPLNKPLAVAAIGSFIAANSSVTSSAIEASWSGVARSAARPAPPTSRIRRASYISARVNP